MAREESEMEEGKEGRGEGAGEGAGKGKGYIVNVAVSPELGYDMMCTGNQKKKKKALLPSPGTIKSERKKLMKCLRASPDGTFKLASVTS